MKTITVIDTFGFFFRNYYALPHLKSKKGFPTGLLTGFINFIGSLNKEYNTDYILFALDSKEKNLRKEIDPNYKANRPEPPEELKEQLPVAVEWIKKMGFKELSIDGYEADDIIASIVKLAKKRGIRVNIVSHDKDLYQLIDDKKSVIFDPMKKRFIDEEGCKEKFGVEPKQIVDYLALVGDSSDNIPGVKGIGPKGAVKLLKAFGTLENIYNNLDKIDNPRTKKLLIEGKERAFLSKKLATLHDDLLDDEDFEKFKFPSNNPILQIADELIDLDMNAILRRAGASYEKNRISCEANSSFTPNLIDNEDELFKIIESIESGRVVAFDTETTSLNPLRAKIVGFSFSFDESSAYYVPIAHSYLGVGDQISLKSAQDAIERLFNDFKIVGQNLKYDLLVLKRNFGLYRPPIVADTMIISWLLDSSLSSGLDNMAKRYFNYDMVKFKDVVKKGENFATVELSEACRYASEDAWMTLKLYNFLKDKLDATLAKEAKEVEYPFIYTLMDMEECGIKIDTDFFSKLLAKANDKLANLTTKIYELAGTEFNINSTQQLGSILFEKLNLPKGKKTKTGYSTNESVLNSLKEAHPIIPLLLEYREVYKLKSTYIEPLMKLAFEEDDFRVHTSFLQTGTTTGRLSSKNPNLQNIPVRTELGREIREGFVAEEGKKLISIDYSQIELRLLAHFSQDSSLLKAFREDKDIHLETAIKLFGEAEAKEKRNIAKSINFGLLYGMGSRKLAQTLGISTKLAKEYIQNYFSSFPTVKNYLEEIKERAKRDNEIRTLLGRRRVFDYTRASAFEKASFERESVNTLFQGSAADIIKLAMNKIDASLLDENAKMLLQIHDELIFEVVEDKAEEFANQAKDLMEHIYKLNVPLKCSVSIGNNWGELK